MLGQILSSIYQIYYEHFGGPEALVVLVFVRVLILQIYTLVRATELSYQIKDANSLKVRYFSELCL